MPRKGHKKSRAGCAECKRRRIKCDEVQPVCGRCSLASRECFYEGRVRISEDIVPTILSSENELRTSSGGCETSSQPATDHSQGRRDQLSVVSPSEYELYLNTDLNVSSDFDELNLSGRASFIHLELFYNFEHNTCKTVARTEAEIIQYRNAIIGRAFVRPYLMHALLGLSALQLSLERPSQGQSYKRIATELQSSALKDFDSNCLSNVNASNVLDLLLFQHMTALQVFCDLFHNFDHNFNELLEQLVGCVRLLRGMNIVVQEWWDFLSRTEIGALMQTSDAHQGSDHTTLGECEDLKSMCKEADLSAKSIEVCLTSTSTLQAYFDAENGFGDKPIGSTNMLFSWLIVSSLEYIELLDQRKPEALLILAYYAVLLHRRRKSWVVADAGRKLLQQIKGYLGKKWEPQLAWPDRCINTE